MGEHERVLRGCIAEMVTNMKQSGRDRIAAKAVKALNALLAAQPPCAKDAAPSEDAP